MIRIPVPGAGTLFLEHLVLDYNGTLACDGRIRDGVPGILQRLAPNLTIHVLTADTFGKVREATEGLPCRLTILPRANQAEGKREYVRRLGAETVVCIGNGRNDRLMLREAALGITVVQEEGAAGETLLASDVVCTRVTHALELLSNPLRLTATLRT